MYLLSLKRILLLLFLFLLFTSVSFSQYSPVDSINTALLIARGAIQKADSGLTYVTPADLAALEITVEGDTSRYTTTAMDSLLDIVAAEAWTDAIPASGYVPSGGATTYVLTKNSATSYDYSWQVSTGGSFNKTSYRILEMAYVDTFLVFWVDSAIVVDSIKVQSDDSVSIQIGLPSISEETFESYMFTGGAFVDGSDTITTFNNDTIDINKKAYLYFILIGDNLSYLNIKFYWRYL